MFTCCKRQNCKSRVGSKGVELYFAIWSLWKQGAKDEWQKVFFTSADFYRYLDLGTFSRYFKADAVSNGLDWFSFLWKLFDFYDPVLFFTCSWWSKWGQVKWQHGDQVPGPGEIGTILCVTTKHHADNAFIQTHTISCLNWGICKFQ